MIRRTFHSIGQGAFYSERHEGYNIVYDCGEWKDSNLADRVINQSFSQDDIINILFISHFDYDHVSKISTLKNHVSSIENVVLPLLHANEKILLLNIYKALNLNIIELLDNPAEYFGANTKIIYVRPSATVDAISVETEPIDINTIAINAEIDSGTAISMGNIDDWIFIPYNHQYAQRNTSLETELASEGFNVDKLKNDSTYSLERIINDTKLTKKQGGKRFKQVYERLQGNINQNSMLLYSGARKNNSMKTYINSFYSGLANNCYYCFLEHFAHPFKDREACIYTGDADFNITNIHTIFNAFWVNVGIIQIPHHGDLKMFDSIVLVDERRYYCPVSFATNNSYGHPSSKVISEILAKHSFPIMVTEKLDSTFIEIIKEY